MSNTRRVSRSFLDQRTPAQKTGLGVQKIPAYQSGNADNQARRPALLNNLAPSATRSTADAITHAHLTNGPPYQV